MKKFILLIVCSWAISLTYAISVSQSNSQTVIDTVIVEMPEHCIVVTDQQNGWQFYQETDSFLVATGFYASSIQSNGDYASSDGDIITDATILYSKNAGGEMTQVQLTDVSCSVRPNDTKDTIRFTTWMITDVGRMYEIHMAYYKPIPKDTVDITIDNCKFADGREINDAWSMYETSEDGKYFLMISPRGDSLEGRWEKDFMFMGDDFCENYQSFYIISNGLQKGIYLMDGWFESHIENYNLVAEAEFLCSDDICYRFHLSAYIAPVVSVHIGVDALCEDMGYVQYEDIVYHKGDTITIFAEANLSYHFTQWSDGNTENPRAIVLTQDTVINALFALDYSGTCGDALYWIYNDSCLTITGTGTMYDYTFSNVPWQLLRDGISSLFIGEQVESIGENAFINCYKLDDVSIPNSVTSIGESAFAGCSSLTKLICEGHVENITNSAIRNCYALDTIIISAQAFDVEESMWTSMPKNIRYIQLTGGELTDNAFNVILRNYKTLGTLDLAAATNTTLSDEAFKGCYNLQTLVFPAQLTSIPYMAVADCKALQAITIPATVEEIDNSAFENCRSIRSITFEGAAAPENGGANFAPAVATSALWRIGNWAFYNCHQLQHLTIPESVTEIGDAAFYGCTYLEDMTLPSSMRKIGDNTFALCSKLQKIHVRALVPPTIEAKTFEDVDRATPVFVPKGTLERYQADEYWSEFFNMAEYEAPTGNLNTNADEANGMRKVVRNGQVLIIRGDKTYNMMGQELSK